MGFNLLQHMTIACSEEAAFFGENLRLTGRKTALRQAAVGFA
jgi:hypothetical protein